MIDIRYIKFLLFAAAACGLFASYMWMRGGMTDVSASVFSFVLGAALTSLITVRLPVFRRYYNAVSPEETQRYRGPANEKAAPVLASLVAGVTVGMVLYVLGVKDIVEPAFIGALCAGVVGQYHRKKR
jgi:prepilin signal peptidase PulO-like enzyme (type II secretory pathway)